MISCLQNALKENFAKKQESHKRGFVHFYIAISETVFFEISVWYDKENYKRERRSIIVEECGGLEIWKKTLILQHLANY